MARHWTKDDDIYLEYFIFSKDEKLEVAAEFLNRSLNATIKRAAIVRKKRRDYYVYRPWSEREDNYIRDNYKSMGYAAIGLRLNRSGKSVSDRARKLKLRKNNSLVALDDKIRQMADGGTYPVDIARNLNLDYETLRCYLKKHNIDYQAMPSEESLDKARANSPWHMYK